MADQQKQVPIAAPFPAPPPFYHHFTHDNLANLRRLRKEASRPQQEAPTNGGSSTDNKPPPDILALPAELRYLIPPPPPPPGTPYRTFGSTINLAAPDLTLEEAGIHQLFPSHAPSQDEEQNPQPHLLALARSTLTTFLALIGSLATNPSLFEERVEDLQTLMYNLHDLVNRYRPHQARESLILMMEDRVGRIRQEVRRINEAKEKVTGLMGGLIESDMSDGATNSGELEEIAVKGNGGESWQSEQGSLWKAMDGEMAEVAS